MFDCLFFDALNSSLLNIYFSSCQSSDLVCAGDAKGIEIKRANESVYTFPCPDCMCRSNKSEHPKSIQAR
jgi:hypothetical protein